MLVLFDESKYRPPPLARRRERFEHLIAGLFPGSPPGRRTSDLLLHRDHDMPVALTPDGKELAVWDETKNRLSIVDLTTGREFSVFDLAPLAQIRSLRFFNRGDSLAMGSRDFRVRVWHRRRGQQPLVLAGHTQKEAWSVAFSPDGRRIASAGDDHKIRFWDAETGRSTGIIHEHGSLVTSLAFSPRGDTLFSGSFDKASRTMSRM